MPRPKLMRYMGAVAFALTVPSWAVASTILAGAADSDYTNLSALPAYEASGYVSINFGGGNFSLASGTLVAPDWVLTAAHAVDGAVTAPQVTFGQGASRPGGIVGPFTVDQIVLAPGWTGNSSAGNDLALIHLTSNVLGVTLATLYDSTALGTEKGQTATVVGYQRFTGTGLTGNTTASSARRAMTNVVDAFGGETTAGLDENNTATNFSFASYSSNLMLTDFDSPDNADDGGGDGDLSDTYNLMGSGDPTATEGAQVTGDSGGGLFLTITGNTYLAGVSSFIGNFEDPPLTHGSNVGFYGDFNAYTRVSQWLSFINSTIPEPSAAALLLLTGLPLVRRARR